MSFRLQSASAKNRGEASSNAAANSPAPTPSRAPTQRTTTKTSSARGGRTGGGGAALAGIQQSHVQSPRQDREETSEPSGQQTNHGTLNRKSGCGARSGPGVATSGASRSDASLDVNACRSDS